MVFEFFLMTAATVVVFPSDHFVLDEERFMGAVEKAVEDSTLNPTKMVLLGMTPHAGEETEYGYIKGARKQGSDSARPVAGFVEKPALPRAMELIQQGALWNTMVFAAQSAALWDMVKQSVPILYHAFRLVQMTLNNTRSMRLLDQIYETIPSVNFSSAICQPLPARLRVLPVADVGLERLGHDQQYSADRTKARSIRHSFRPSGQIDSTARLACI